MDEQLDNHLKNRIREAFENFDDPSADEGWLKLRLKYPDNQPNRRVFAWIWWGAAAILFLFLGIGLWINYVKIQPEKFSAKTSTHKKPENLTNAEAHHHTDNKAGTVYGENLPKTAINNSVLKPNFAKSGTPAKYISPYMLNQPVLKDDSAKNRLLAKITDTVKSSVYKAPAQQLAVIAQPTSTPSNPAIVSPQPTAPLSGPAIITPQPAARSITSMLTEESVAKRRKSPESGDDTKKVHFGLYTATYFNYAKGSDNQINLGAGFNADIKLTKNLKLVTGVAIAQNTLNYTGTPPPAAAASQNNLLDKASVSPATQSFIANAGPTFKNYNANLVGLDIPLNLKYEFNPKKNDTYISAGLSSGTFINESYTYQYNYPAFFSPSLQQTQGETSRKSFNSFYLAKTLNVAFGAGYPLGKNRLIIEPFLKYPLQGLGSQNIRFGAGGINLKFNFQSAKK